MVEFLLLSQLYAGTSGRNRITEFLRTLHVVAFCSSTLANDTLLWAGDILGAEQPQGMELQEMGLQDVTEDEGAYVYLMGIAC